MEPVSVWFNPGVLVLLRYETTAQDWLLFSVAMVLPVGLIFCGALICMNIHIHGGRTLSGAMEAIMSNFKERTRMDGGTYSEAIAGLRLYVEWLDHHQVSFYPPPMSNPPPPRSEDTSSGV